MTVTWRGVMHLHDTYIHEHKSVGHIGKVAASLRSKQKIGQVCPELTIFGEISAVFFR